MKKQFNYWKIIAILFLLFGIVLFFYSEDKNKQLAGDYNECINQEEVCEYVLNQTLSGWKTSMYALGEFYNVTKEEIDKEFEEFENFNLKEREVIK